MPLKSGVLASHEWQSAVNPVDGAPDGHQMTSHGASLVTDHCFLSWALGTMECSNFAGIAVG